MKRVTAFIILLVALLSGCASNSTTSSNAALHEGGTEPRDVKPKVGMMRSQVTQLYGKPDEVVFGPKGEIWRYWFNRGSAFWTGHFRVAFFTFDSQGKLIDFVFNE